MSLIPSLFGNNRRGSSSSIFDPFSLNAWDPWSEFQMQFPNTETSSSLVSGAARVDWKETPEAHMFKADIPGLKKEEVKVEVDEDRVLQIRGERTTDKEEKTDTWHRVERSTGKFVRRFRLPENAKMDGITAAMENGVLTVTVPKEEAKNQDVKSIQISG